MTKPWVVYRLADKMIVGRFVTKEAAEYVSSLLSVRSGVGYQLQSDHGPIVKEYQGKIDAGESRDCC